MIQTRSSSKSSVNDIAIEENFYHCLIDLSGKIVNLPPYKPLDPTLNRPPKRNHFLNKDEQEMALQHALNYFSDTLHDILRNEFKKELKDYGHIYMYRYRPPHNVVAAPFHLIRQHTQTDAAAAMIHMIDNNLDPQVAQHPDELITYGGNGAIFSNWAQYHLTRHYLCRKGSKQKLSMLSGHPLGLFPASGHGSDVVITNGLMIPHYSSTENYDRLYALSRTMYGQMTAGSWMYIGPQGIVHGTTLTIAGALKLQNPQQPEPAGKLYVTSGLGGMSGAQPKAASINGCVSITAEINEKALEKRHEQGWFDEQYADLDKLLDRTKQAQDKQETVALAYLGNVVDLWEALAKRDDIRVDIGSDQTSLHIPFTGGYYPAGLSKDDADAMMSSDPEQFKTHVRASLRRHIAAVNILSDRGMFFFDYGNAFLKEAMESDADLPTNADGTPRYKSYVEHIMGPEYFDYGFGPFRWVCTSGLTVDLHTTDRIAEEYLKEREATATDDIRQQIVSNRRWIETAEQNRLVVGSKARILYTDCEGRVELAKRFNDAIARGDIQSPIVLGRDHHDVSGTDSPFRETSNIYDGSNITADLSIQNAVGNALEGATWVSIHNGGGVGWGQVSNCGFGHVLDGSHDSGEKAKTLLFWDVSSGLVRRARAGNPHAKITVDRLSKAFHEFDPNTNW